MRALCEITSFTCKTQLPTFRCALPIACFQCPLTGQRLKFQGKNTFELYLHTSKGYLSSYIKQPWLLFQHRPLSSPVPTLPTIPGLRQGPDQQPHPPYWILDSLEPPQFDSRQPLRFYYSSCQFSPPLLLRRKLKTGGQSRICLL